MTLNMQDIGLLDFTRYYVKCDCGFTSTNAQQPKTSSSADPMTCSIVSNYNESY